MGRRYLPRAGGKKSYVIPRRENPAFLSKEEREETLVRLRKDLESYDRALTELRAQPAGDVNQSRKKREALNTNEQERAKIANRIRTLDPHPEPEDDLPF